MLKNPVLKTTTECVVVIVLTAFLALVVGIVTIPKSLSAHSADMAKAKVLNAQTDAANVRIGHGEYVQSHSASEMSKARTLSQLIPPLVDDQSIIGGVLNAASSSGVETPGENRGAAVSKGTVTAIPVTTGANGNADGLISFVANLQRQPRAFDSTALNFDFKSNTLTMTTDVFTGPPIPSLVVGGQ